MCGRAARVLVVYVGDAVVSRDQRGGGLGVGGGEGKDGSAGGEERIDDYR